jgi:hypothetical protein
MVVSSIEVKGMAVSKRKTSSITNSHCKSHELHDFDIMYRLKEQLHCQWQHYNDIYILDGTFE